MKYLIIILLLFLLIAIIAIVYCFIEAHLLDISYVHLSPSSSDDTSKIIKLPKEYSHEHFTNITPTDSIHVIYFSDLHAEFCFIPASRVCSVVDDAIKNHQIEAVIFGGDISNNPNKSHVGIEYINVIANHCSKKGIPFIGTTGNHDVELSEKDLSDCKFINLNNTCYKIRNFEFRGVYDSGRTNRVWDLNPFNSHENTNVLLSHNPDWLLQYKDDQSLKNIDYMLSGHIHGGQIRLPWGLENILFRKDLLPLQKVVMGVFDGFGVKFFISRGIGCVLLPFRLFSKPEISIIEIEHKKRTA